MDKTLTSCKCGNPSKGNDLTTFYKKKDGTISKYVQKEKRCQKCINLQKLKRKRKNLLVELMETDQKYNMYV